MLNIKLLNKLAIASLAISTLTVSCKKDDENNDDIVTNPQTVTLPTTYSFERNEATSVSYSGQEDRLDMLSEMVSYMKGQISSSSNIEASKLKDMYANSNTPFTNSDLNVSTKQLKSKTFQMDQTWFESWMDKIETASMAGYIPAENGKAGVMVTPDGTSTYLMDENGIEPVQIIEKGLMGAVFFYQAMDYFTKVESDNNEDLVADKNYTEMEHHFDEAFGYFGVPTDFPTTTTNRFWGKYCNSQDGDANTNETMMSNFIAARYHIVAKSYDDRDAAIDVIRQTWEEISARQAVKYLNSYTDYIAANNTAKAYHALSEAYAFVYNLKFAPLSTTRTSAIEVQGWLDNTFGDNMYNVSPTELNTLKTELTNKYNF